MVVMNQRSVNSKTRLIPRIRSPTILDSLFGPRGDRRLTLVRKPIARGVRGRMELLTFPELAHFPTRTTRRYLYMYEMHVCLF